MFPFTDPRLNSIFHTGSCVGIPDDVGQRIYLILHVLVHTREFSSIGLVGYVHKLWRNRFAIYVDTWAVTFSWDWDHRHVIDAALEDL